MKISLRNKILIEDCYTNLIKYLKEKLTIDNPAYKQALERWFSTWGKQKQLTYYFQIKDSNKKDTNNIIVPRGMIWEILTYCKEYNLNYTLVDNRAPFISSEVNLYPNAKIQLKPNQIKPIESLKKIQQWIWISPAGSWKTVMALDILAERNSSGLILVHTNSLLDQFKERISSFLWIDKSEIWTISEWKINIKQPITIGLIQTVQSLDEKEVQNLTAQFWTTVIDECLVYNTKIRLKDWEKGEMIEETIWDLYTKYFDKDPSIYPEVLSLNEQTWKLEYKKIKRVIKLKKRCYPTVVEAGKSIIQCTGNHKFFTNKGWVFAKDLQQGSHVCIASDWQPQYIIRSCQQIWWKGKRWIIDYYYDLEIEDNHNFFAEDILVHNCHHVPATTFSKFAENVTSKYFYGLTATKYRGDWLEVLLDFYIWNTIFEIRKEDLQDSNILLKPNLVPIYSSFKSKNQADYNKLTEELVNDIDRNTLILNTISSEFDKGNYCLVLSKRVEHINKMARMFEERYPFDQYAIIIWGSTKESKHERLIREIQYLLKNKEKVLVVFKTENSLEKFKGNMKFLDISKDIDIPLIKKPKGIDFEKLIQDVNSWIKNWNEIIFLYNANKYLEELKLIQEFDYIKIISEDEDLECEDVTQIAIDNKEIRMIFATMQKVWEWYDVPHLNRLFLTTPVSDLKNIEQYVWRVARTSPWKENAIVYDIVDQDSWPRSWILWYYFKKRFYGYYKNYTINPTIRF